MPSLSKSLADKFWAKVLKQGDADCWIWQAATHKNGYGKFSTPFSDRAHRVSWILATGDLPGDLCVCHKCDNRLCVNPKHLFLGTVAENIADKTLKNRQAKGQDHGMHKLTDQDVAEIRAAKISQHKLAAKYNVSQTLVSYIRSNKIWKHL